MNCYNFSAMKMLVLAFLYICTPPLERPEWWLVGVGIVTCVVIAWQSWETGKAAQAAKKAAEAALMNAQAVINAERAWIVVGVEFPKFDQFVFKATNVGRTPAKITSIWGANAVQRIRNDKVQLAPGYEKGESLLSTPPQLLPPTASCIAFACTLDDLRGEYSSEEWTKRLEDGLSTVWTYGRITYFDTLEVEIPVQRETKWFYWHVGPVGAPVLDPFRPEYNSYT
jgi:hypothetical protein